MNNKPTFSNEAGASGVNFTQRSRHCACFRAAARRRPAARLGVGSLPLVLACVYVFALRQGRPRSYDADLLETLLNGRAWMPPRRQPRNPIDDHESA